MKIFDSKTDVGVPKNCLNISTQQHTDRHDNTMTLHCYKHLSISVHVCANSFHTTLLLHIWTTKFGFVQAIFALSAIIPVAIRTFTTCLATFAPRSHFIYFFMAEIRISTIECALENWSVVNCANNVSSMYFLSSS